MFLDLRKPSAACQENLSRYGMVMPQTLLLVAPEGSGPKFPGGSSSLVQIYVKSGGEERRWQHRTEFFVTAVLWLDRYSWCAEYGPQAWVRRPLISCTAGMQNHYLVTKKPKWACCGGSGGCGSCDNSPASHPKDAVQISQCKLLILAKEWYESAIKHFHTILRGDRAVY